MRKYSWLVALFAIMAITFGGFVSCKSGGGSKNVTIEFHANEGEFADGAIIKSVEIAEGKTVTAPTDVTLEGHKLAGWNTAANGTGQTLTASTVHTTDTRYFAMWSVDTPEEVEAKISIDVDGTIVDNILVTSSGTDVQRTVVPIDGVNGFQLIGVSGGHRGKYAWFELDLYPKKLSDFQAIEFDFEVVSCADAYRRLALIASASMFPGSLGTHPLGGSNLTTNPFGSDFGFLAAGQVTKPLINSIQVEGVDGNVINAVANPSSPTKVTLEIVPAVSHFTNFDSTGVPVFADATATAALNASKVFLSIYEHTDATANIKISNIKLVPRPTDVCPIDGTNVVEGEACSTCNTAIAAAKTLIEGTTFTAAPQANAFAQAAAIGAALAQVNALTLDDVIANVVAVSFTGATAGTFASQTGTNGSFTFKVELERGWGDADVTIERTMTITATPYAPCTLCNKEPCECVVLYDMRNDTNLVAQASGGNLPGAFAWITSSNGSDGNVIITAVPDATITLTGRGGVGQTVRVKMTDIDAVAKANHLYRIEYLAIIANANGTPRLRMESGTLPDPTSGTNIVDGPAAVGGVIRHGITLTRAQVASNASAGLSLSESTGSANITFYDIRIIEIPLPPDAGADNAAIAAAKTAIEGATYTFTTETTTGTIEQARARVQTIISGLSLDGVETEIVNGAFTAALDGTPGSFAFTVKLNRGLGTEVTTDSRTLVITYQAPQPFNIVRNGFAGDVNFEVTSAVLAAAPNGVSTTVPISRWGDNAFSLVNGNIIMGPRGGNGGIVLNLAPLGLDVTNNRYEVVITGTTTAGALRINADASMTTGGLTFAEINGTANSYNATFTLGATADPVRNPLAIRLTGNQAAVGGTTTITSITITRVIPD
jgi:hypothetical protein